MNDTPTNMVMTDNTISMKFAAEPAYKNQMAAARPSRQLGPSKERLKENRGTRVV